MKIVILGCLRRKLSLVRKLVVRRIDDRKLDYRKLDYRKLVYRKRMPEIPG